MSMRFGRRDISVGPGGWTMAEMKPEPLDYVEDFQDYLDQQNHRAEMQSGSVEAQKQTEHRHEGVIEEEHATAMDQLASIEVCVDDDVIPGGFEKIGNGRMKCLYCNYTNRSTPRLIEHVRIHTGEKPHCCPLCPFSSAYLRHLEAHLRSHSGEKPYKCGLCSFRCNDRSNLSRHRRRHHKHRSMRAAKGPPDVLAVLPKDGPAPPPDDPLPSATERPDCANGFRPKSPRRTENPSQEDAPGAPFREERLDLTSTSIILSPGSSSTSVPHVPPRTLYYCAHCQTYFSDNIMYTVHMGCHGYDQPFQCNVCGEHCGDKYTFACHYARGLHRK